MISPRDQFAIRVDATLEEMKSRGTIEVVRHVVFTRPQKFHRHADLFRDGCGLNDIIVAKTSAEASAYSQQMDLDVRRRDAEGPRHQIQSASGRLRRSPDFHL